MSTPYIKEFETRLRRIAKIRSKGGGFEAAGTLGQSYYTRQSRRRRAPVLRYALIILAAVVLFKGLTLTNLGAAEYAKRVDALKSGTMVEQMGAMLMAPDPMTLTLSRWMTVVLN